MKAFTIEKLLRVTYSRHRRPFDFDCNAIQCAYTAGQDALADDVEVVSNLLLQTNGHIETAALQLQEISFWQSVVSQAHTVRIDLKPR